MPTLLKKALSLIVGDEAESTSKWLKVPKKRPLKQFTERELIRLESEIGAQLFGQLPRGRRREFFCLDETTWIWHEEWIDEHRKHRVTTTRYEIQDNGILKVQEGARYSYLEGAELENLTLAIKMYYERVAREIYKIDPDTGEPIAE